eukprot:TRINITY_DN5060_c0_g1_i1.p1 TRINITY_DN5060_c0_g1~~TRINITY_DN5060_c0_g1_i1.p1  ORF type:complete len:678 (+),score=147.77 TRINITY_DN5060_c0_g1_i1:174-2207(+)
MKIKNWIGLLLVYVSYLCLGGFAFQKLECPNSIEIRREQWITQKNMTKDLEDFMTNLDEIQKDEFQQFLDSYIEVNNVTEFDERCLKWDFYNSLFFSFTAVTTIGYGHQAPATNPGKTFCVFYSLLGIPLNAILIGAMGNLFSLKMSQLKERMIKAGGGHDVHQMGKVGKIVLEGTVFLFVLTLVFLFIPAAVFTSSEDQTWEYVDSLYYAFITLSTIGFGDMVAGRNNDMPVMKSNVSKMMYQIGIIIWIILGLGYIVGVVNVLVKALQSSSKPVKRVIRGIKNQIHVQDYWRKILTEIIDLKKSEGWIQDDLLEDGAGGGSEPNLGHLEVSSDKAKRRAASTGDLDTAQEADFDSAQRKEGSRNQSLQDLDKGSEMLADIQELNEDTITSLRHFLTTSKMAGQPTDTNFASWLANNVPDSGMSLPSTRPVTRQNSASYTHTVQPGIAPRTQRFQSVHNPQRLRRRSVVSRHGSVTSQNSLPAVPAAVGLLERTSLAEFLTAVEKVRARSEAELQATLAAEEEERKRKPSVLRKISMRMTGGGGGGDKREAEGALPAGPLTLNQVTTMLNSQRDSPGSDRSIEPLVRSPSGRSARSVDTERSTIDPNSPVKIQHTYSSPLPRLGADSGDGGHAEDAQVDEVLVLDAGSIPSQDIHRNMTVDDIPVIMVTDFNHKTP